jgi:hypothetical protein
MNTKMRGSQTEGIEDFASELEAFRTRCFWSLSPGWRVIDLPLEEIVRILKLHGGHAGWMLAARLCRSLNIKDAS